jgi:cytochrome bd-type quinol oxidase subunit 2
VRHSSALERWLAGAALFVALSASLAWLLVPGTDAATLPDEIGSSAYAWLALPLLIASLPILARRQQHRATVIAAWLMLAYCTITGFSIGILYWPSFVLMVLAAYAGARARRAQIVP